MNSSSVPHVWKWTLDKKYGNTCDSVVSLLQLSADVTSNLKRFGVKPACKRTYSITIETLRKVRIDKTLTLSSITCYVISCQFQVSCQDKMVKQKQIGKDKIHRLNDAKSRFQRCCTFTLLLYLSLLFIHSTADDHIAALMKYTNMSEEDARNDAERVSVSTCSRYVIWWCVLLLLLLL